jgi:hypothetical protein
MQRFILRGAPNLSFVRAGRKAEAFKVAFRHFVADFPGAPAVTVPEGELQDIGIYLAKIEPELRRNILKRWAEIIRSKAQQSHHMEHQHD